MPNARDDVEKEELAEEVCEEEFMAKYMPEDRESDIAINFFQHKLSRETRYAQ